MINVIIPAYNCRKTLGRTLSSLVAQTDTNFEVIIVDDCSTENIKEIVDDYLYKLNIIYIRNDKNIGPGMSRQVGIDNATQKFITFLDSDDMFMPYAIETFNSIIDANPNLEYLHSYFYEQISIDDNPALYLFKDNYSACHGKLYNVDLIREYGIRNSPEVRWADDSFFNSICSELMNMSIISIPTVLWCYNKESVLHKNDEERDANIKEDFINAIFLSSAFVFDKKGRVDHLDQTIKCLFEKFCLSEEEKEKVNVLFNRFRGEA